MRVVLCLFVLAALLPGDADAGLLAPTDGAIEEVLLTVPADDLDGRGIAARTYLSGVVRALGPEVRYLIHAYPRHRGRIDAVLQESGAKRRHFLPSAFGHYTRWARDLFLVQQGPAGLWWVPAVVPRRLDASTAIEIAGQLRRPVERLAGEVAGGNLVPFGRWIFAGRDLLLDGNGRPSSERRRMLEHTLAPRRNWIWIGTNKARHSADIWRGRYQPLFHIDLLLTALGPDRNGSEQVAVASPRLGRQLLGLAEQPADRDGDYDAIAAALEDRGFKVSRLPLLIEESDAGAGIAGHANALLAVDGNRRLAYLPRYAGELTALDRYAARRYQEAGYTVRWVDGPWRELGRDFGALRCLVQVTRRHARSAEVFAGRRLEPSH